MLWRWLLAPLRRRTLVYTAWTLLELEKRSADEGLEAEHWLEYLRQELGVPDEDLRTIRELILVHRAILAAREDED